MEIRDATRDDVPAIVALLAADSLGQQRETAGGSLPPGYWDAFESIDADPNHRLVVVEDAGEVIGTLQLSFLPNMTFEGGLRAQIEGVRIASWRRGEGLGQTLIEWAIAEAERRGCRLVQLTTNKARTDAHRFYESLGFDATHEGMKLYLPRNASGA